MIRASTVTRLKTKWSVQVNEMVPTTPAVVDGIVYFGTWEGVFYAVDEETGRTIWTFDARALAGDETAWRKRGIGIRGGITVNGGRVYFGDTAGYLMACDAKTGRLIWRKRLEQHPHVRVFSAAKTSRGGSSSAYRLSRNRRSVSIRPTTGTRSGAVFYASTLPPAIKSGGSIPFQRPPPRLARRKADGRCLVPPAPRFGPRQRSTRNGDYFTSPPEMRYSGPKQFLTRSEAVLALGMDTGKVVWERQARPGADALYTNERLSGEDEGPDLDFGQSPILFGGPHGNQWLACGQKSGWMYLLNAENGAKLWQTKVGAAGGLGGLEFGSATDGDRIFGAIAAGEGNVAALDGRTGKILWQTWNGIGVNHAPVTIAGPKDDLVVFEGSNRGVLRAYDGKDGHVLWSYEFSKGTSIQGGATVANGMVFVGAGYHSALGGGRKGAGNELRAFSLDSQ